MSPSEHYLIAEGLVERAEGAKDSDVTVELLAIAQVHATLACATEAYAAAEGVRS